MYNKIMKQNKDNVKNQKLLLQVEESRSSESEQPDSEYDLPTKY